MTSRPLLLYVITLQYQRLFVLNIVTMGKGSLKSSKTAWRYLWTTPKMKIIQNTQKLRNFVYTALIVFSCINPLVYGFMSKNFRESFLSDIRLCCRLGRNRGRNASRRNSRGFPTSGKTIWDVIINDRHK